MQYANASLQYASFLGATHILFPVNYMLACNLTTKKSHSFYFYK